jgi:hypothetical protein
MPKLFFFETSSTVEFFHLFLIEASAEMAEKMFFFKLSFAKKLKRFRKLARFELISIRIISLGCIFDLTKPFYVFSESILNNSAVISIILNLYLIGENFNSKDINSSGPFYVSPNSIIFML